jgi:uncharacterized membrane protein
MIRHEVRRPATVAATESRVPALDAARGAAMVFVCISHFANAYLVPAGAPRVAGFMTSIAMVATPTFIVVSGLLVGYLSAVAGSQRDAYRVKLFDRGLFLLIVGHAWMSATAAWRAGGLSTPLTHAFITDVIGVALLIMVPIVTRTHWRRRLEAGIGLAVLGYAFSLMWHPTTGWLEVFEETLIGWIKVDTFPLLPWLGVYLAGTALGTRLSPLLRVGREREAGQLMLSIGLGTAALAALLRAVLRTQPAHGSDVLTLLNALTTPWAKVPPSPGYLMFFGGCGLILAGSLLAAPRGLRGWVGFRALTLLGRNSLFAYLLQNLIYFVLLYGLALTYHPAWPLLFVASLAAVLLLAGLWETIHGNRFVTVGYPAVRAAWRARFHSANAT